MREKKSSRKKKVSTIDPFCTISSRRQIVKTKENQRNNAPDKIDDQPMSQKLKDLIKAMEPIKRQRAGLKAVKRPPQDRDDKEDNDDKEYQPISKKARKRKKAQDEQHKLNKVQNTLDQEEKLTRLPGESDKKFLRRVRVEADKDVRSQMDKIKLFGKHEDDILGMIGEKKSSAKDKERLKKLHERKKRKKFEKNLDKLEEQFFKDKVEFGEVAVRPPELSFQPRKSLPSHSPGTRKLLLSNLMDAGDTQKPTTSSQAAKGAVQKKTKTKGGIKKRKDMNKAEKRQFDAMRDDAILAYRKLKAKAIAERTAKL